MFHARPVAALAQTLLIAKEFGDLSHHGHSLILLHESIQAHGQVRIGGEASAHPQRKSHLAPLACRAHSRGQANVIDFRIGAPYGAAGDRDLELSRQVVKLWVAL